MAKRRLNKKFVGLLAGGVLGLAALAVGALELKNAFLVQHPERYLAAGRDALAKKDYVGARDNLAHAAALSHPDAALDVLLGDALNGLSGKDPDNVAAARGMWEQALTIDPNNTAAMERLIKFWRDELELHPRAAERAQAAEQLHKAAEKLNARDPNSHLANVTLAESKLETMLDGLQVSSGEAGVAEQALLNLEAEDPADADIPYYAARGYVFQGQDADRSDDPAGKSRYFASAEKVMADAVKDQPGNAAMHYRNGQIMLQIASSEMANADPSDATKDFVAKALGEIDLARELAKPDDPHYLDINLYDARLVLERPSYAPDAPLARSGAPTSAPAADGDPQITPSNPIPSAANQPARTQVVESIYRDVLSHRPNDPATRLALAQLLGNLRGRRDEAIAILSTPMIDNYPVPGIKGTLLPVFQAQANIHLLSLDIDAIEATKDSQKRQTLLAAADALCDRVYSKNPDSAMVVGLKGRLQLVHNQVVEATQTLRHALALTDPQDNTQTRSRYELLFNLARACEMAQQTGDAKKYAIDIVKAYPRFIPANMMLARLLITEHDFAGAKQYIDFLESILATNPELTIPVVRMRIATLDPVHDADRIRAYFNRLPEDTRDQRMDKAALAHLVKYDDEALRLETLVHTASPGDVEAATDLATWYQSHDQKQKAIDVLAQALAVNPSDSNLLAFQMQLEGKTLAQADSSQPPVAQTTTAPVDAFSAEIAQVEVARAHGDMAAVDSHLAAAEKLRPDEPHILDAIFTRALDTSNWSRASVYLEKIAAANVDSAGGLIYRVRYSLARNDIQKAKELALQLTQEKPEFSQSWCMLGLAQKAAGNYDDAITNFQQALERQVQNLEAIRGAVDCSYALSNVEQAKTYIDMGRRVAPGNESFKELALTYELNYGDPQKVIEPRLQAMHASPDNQQAWLNLTTAYVDAARSRTKVQDSAGADGYYQQAKSLLKQAIAKFPDTPRFAVYLSKLDLDSGDFPTAEQVMLDFSGQPLQKGRPQTALILSDFYDLAGKSDQAVKILSDYLASPFQQADHADNVQVQLHLSVLLANLKRYDDALAVLANNAQDPQIVRERVSLLISAGRLADAEKVLNDLAAVAPLTPDLLTLKGVAGLNGNKLDEAKECFDQVIAAQPNNVYALKERAKTLLRTVPPNYLAAVSDLTRARDLSPQDMDIRLLIVQVDGERNQPDDAIRELESASRAAPSDKRVRINLIGLYVHSNPPRWTDAQRVLREARQIPSLADDPDFMHQEAAMDFGRGEYVKAQELIRAAMQKAPTNLAMVHTYYDILLKSNAFDELLSESAQLLAANQNASFLWWVYPYRAEALAHGTGDKAGAAAELEQGLTATVALHDLAGTSQIIRTYAALLGTREALKVASARAPSDPHWLLLAADLCSQSADPDGAITWLETALQHFDALSPADQNDVLHLAAAQYMAKSPPETLKSADMYRRIINRSPTDIAALNNLACILVEPGPAYQPVEALDHSENAYKQMKYAGLDEPLINDTYGWTLIANDRIEEGLGLIQGALNKAGQNKRDFPEGHYHLAEGLLKRQPPDADDAVAELEKAMGLLTQAESENKPVDSVLKLNVQNELKRVRNGLP